MIDGKKMKSRLQTLLIIKERNKRRSKPKIKKHQSLKNLSLMSIMIVLILVTFIPILGGFFFTQLTEDLPTVDWIPAYLDPENGILLSPTTLLDESGENEIYRLQEPGNQRRFLSIDPNQPEFISPYVVQLAVATIQPDFWSSPGYNKNFLSDKPDRTIAEGLVERLLLWDEPPGLKRDLRMRLLAAQITRKFGRAQVLEWYLNSTTYGHNTIGIDSAAHLYLNKKASQLNLAEAALLTSTSLTPSLNPLDAPQAAMENQEAFLNQLHQAGYVSDEDFITASNTKIVLVSNIQPPDPLAVAFSTFVIEELYDLYGRERVELGGLNVTTTLNISMQNALACTIKSQINKLTGNVPSPPDCEPERLLPSLFEEPNQDLALLGSGVILDPSTGEIVAFVGDLGGSSESSSLGLKQGGTILTPLIAVNAFVRGFAPATQVWDIPTSLPENLSQYKKPIDTYKGPMRLRTALSNNYLAGVTKLYDQLGYDVIARSANSFGLPTLSDLENMEEVLFSGKSTTVLEVANFYSIFANLGIQSGIKDASTGLIEPKTIRKIELSDGLPIQDFFTESQVLLSAQLAYTVHDILQDDYERRETLGYPNPLEIGRPSAAKYGSTFTKDEIWAVGYTPQFVTVFWFGQKGENQTSLNESIAGGVWYALNQWLHKDLPVENWQKPIGISEVVVCNQSGLLPTRECPSTITEIFVDGTQPSTTDNLFKSYEVNRETGLLATVYTPPEMIDSRTYMIVPEEANEWAEFNQIEIPPKDYDLIQAPRPDDDVLITSPENFSYVSGIVEIYATVGIDEITNYRIQVGQGLNPSNWLQIGEDQSQKITNKKVVEWDSTTMEDGLFALRLMVIKENLQIDTHTIQVSVDNTAPEGKIIYPVESQSIARSSQGTITLQADVFDNVGIAAVEWWLDGQLVGKNTKTPYSYPISITSGEHKLSMHVFDIAGNTLQTEEINFTVE